MCGGKGGGLAWLGAANPEWESALENGVRGCVTWKVGGAGGGWLAGWLDGRMGSGRRSVAVLILGQVTRVGTTTGAAGMVAGTAVGSDRETEREGKGEREREMAGDWG